MLLETEKFDGGSLPDVARSVVLPGGSGNVSALAGILAGKDYAKAIYSAAYRPLESPHARLDDLDLPPGQPAYDTQEQERRNLSRSLRNAMTGPGRPDSAPVPQRSYNTATPGVPPTMPDEALPVANSGDPGNLLGAPPPADTPPSLFPEDNLLPPPITPVKDDWNPAVLFGY